MKIRNDFVTNSSSSSYVIAYRDISDEDAETKYGSLYKRLIEAIINCTGYSGDTYPGRVFHTKEEYDTYACKEYGYENAEELNEDCDCSNIYRYLEDGYAILTKSVDYNDDGLSALIREIAKGNTDFVVLEED